jgi:hypothetical protein
MLERAFKLKDAIELYRQYYKADIDEPLEDDYLTTDDWLELSEVLQLLQPLKQVSFTLQADGKDCNHGSLWESLTAIDFLMSRLEELKEHHTFLPASHFKASVNLGWKKLDKYYRLSDKSPAYRAAIAVHPSKKMRWFEAKWNKHHPEWIAAARDDITALYNEYKTRHADEAITSTAPPIELSEFDTYTTSLKTTSITTMISSASFERSGRLQTLTPCSGGFRTTTAIQSSGIWPLICSPRLQAVLLMNAPSARLDTLSTTSGLTRRTI